MNMGALAKAGEKGVVESPMATQSGMTADNFTGIVRSRTKVSTP